jgi:hypothetical protein
MNDFRGRVGRCSEQRKKVKHEGVATSPKPKPPERRTPSGLRNGGSGPNFKPLLGRRSPICKLSKKSRTPPRKLATRPWFFASRVRHFVRLRRIVWPCRWNSWVLAAESLLVRCAGTSVAKATGKGALSQGFPCHGVTHTHLRKIGDSWRKKKSAFAATQTCPSMQRR